MLFQGALIRGICTELTHETASYTVLFQDMITNRRPLSDIARNAQKYVRCSFIGENIEDFEEIFDIYGAVNAAQVVFSDIHAGANWSGAMPPVDLAYRLELPMCDPKMTPADVRRWEAKHRVSLADALDVHWISLDESYHFSIEEYKAKILLPTPNRKI